MRITPKSQPSSHLPLDGPLRSMGQTASKFFSFAGPGDTVTFGGRTPSTTNPDTETRSPQTSNWLLGRGRKNNEHPLETILVLQPDHQTAPPTIRVLPYPNPLPQSPINRRRATSANLRALPMVITTVLGVSLTVLNLTALWARETDEHKDYLEKQLIASLGLWGIGLVVSSFIQNRNELRDLNANQE